MTLGVSVSVCGGGGSEAAGQPGGLASGWGLNTCLAIHTPSIFLSDLTRLYCVYFRCGIEVINFIRIFSAAKHESLDQLAIYL